MEPASGKCAVRVPPTETIQSVMEKVTQTGKPVGVEEDGKVIGQITRDTVLAKLLDPRS